MGGRVHDDPATAPSEHVLTDPDDLAALVTGPAMAGTPAAVDDLQPADPRICPFLRTVDDEARLDPPLDVPHPLNRCAALREPVPQSLRQQELVCLTSGHVNCPRYLRGAVGIGQAPVRVRAQRSVDVTPATAGALAALVLAFVASLAFVVGNGGIALTAAVPASSPTGEVLGAVETPPATTEPTTAPPSPTPNRMATPTATPAATASAVPTASPAPTPSSTPAPTASPSPTAKPTTRPTSGRFALLKPCPDQTGCWIYKVRAGDNLFSIAKYFGVPIATVRAWNPWVKDGLVIGRALKIPTPTR
jgi:LysM repeat protein